MYASWVLTAHLSQVNSFDRADPLSANSVAEALSVSNWTEDSAIEASSLGSKAKDAFPTTSGIELVLTVMIGVPEAIASSRGSPKPSRREGNTMRSAAL